MAKKSLKIEAIFKGIDRITRPVNRMQSRLRRFSKGAKRSLRAVDRIATKVGRTMVRGVAAGFRAATVAAVAFGVATAKIIKTGADFERTLVIAATKFPGEIRRGTEAFENLRLAAKEAGKTTEFTGVQAAEGLKLLGAAGLDVKQAIAVLPDVINLATVAEVELAEASDMAVKTLGVFNLASDDAATNQANLTRVMDVMNKTANSAAHTLTDVFEALKVAGTEAVDFGQSIETVSASVIAMARSGFVGEQAGTAYRNMMMKLTNLTPKAKKEIEALGVSLLDSNKNLRDPITLVGDLSKALDGLGSGERARRLFTIFQARAKGPFGKLIQAGTEQLREWEKAGREAAGSLGRSAAEIQNTTTGSMRQVLSAYEAVKISLFELRGRAIKGVIDRVAEWIRVNEKLIVSKVGAFLEYIEKNFDKIVQTLKTIGAMTGSLFALIGAIKVLKGTMDFVDLLKVLDFKLVAIMAVVTALALAAGFVIANWDEAKAGFKRIWDGIVGIYSKAINYIVREGPISWLVAAVGAVMETWGVIAPFFGRQLDRAKFHFDRFVNAVVKSGPIVWLLEAVDTVKIKWAELKVFFKDLWDTVVATFKVAVTKIRDELGPLIELLKKFFAFKKFLIDKVLPGDEAKVLGAGPTRFGVGIPKVGVPAPPAFGAGFVTRTEQPEAEAPRMVSPQERISRSVSESNKTEKKLAEVTIRDETGRATVTQGDLAQLGFQMLRTGTF